MFFKNAVDILLESGNQVLCTSRRYREAVELARIKHLEIKIVGEHGGAHKLDKLLASARRIVALADIVKKFEPDVALTFSSPEGTRVAFGLGIKQIGFNDSPHAEAVAKLTVPLMDHLLCPWVVPYSAWTGFGLPKAKITKYHALDPAAWLKRIRNKEAKPQLTNPDSSASNTKGEIHIDHGKMVVLIRLEEAKASYIADKKLDSLQMIDGLVASLQNKASVVMLCRYEDQLKEVSKRYEGKASVIKKVVDGTSLISQVDMFVGAGGTMTAEAALMGKPTISIAPVQYYVENYLINSGLIKRINNLQDLISVSSKMIANEKYAARQEQKAYRILDSMEDPTDRIISFIRHLEL